MSSLREILSKAHGVTAPPPLDHDRIFSDYFLPKHKAWMSLPEKERSWSPRALEHCRMALAGEYQRPREGRLSPSSIGTDCERELLFAFAQAPQPSPNPEAQEKMDAGTFEHIRMQMAGLSAGYLSDVEIFVHDAELRCGGSADGRGDDGSLWELKNTDAHLFDPISKGPDFLAGALERERQGIGSAAAYAAHMVRKHKLQMECYWYVDEIEARRTGRPRHFVDEGSLVYMHRGSKKKYEIRIRTSPTRRAAVQAIIDSATGWIDIDQLPDRLHGCQLVFDGDTPSDKELRRHRSCHYIEHCRTAQAVRLT